MIVGFSRPPQPPPGALLEPTSESARGVVCESMSRGTLPQAYDYAPEVVAVPPSQPIFEPPSGSGQTKSTCESMCCAHSQVTTLCQFSRSCSSTACLGTYYFGIGKDCCALWRCVLRHYSVNQHGNSVEIVPDPHARPMALPVLEPTSELARVVGCESMSCAHSQVTTSCQFSRSCSCSSSPACLGTYYYYFGIGKDCCALWRCALTLLSFFNRHGDSVEIVPDPHARPMALPVSEPASESARIVGCEGMCLTTSVSATLSLEVAPVPGPQFVLPSLEPSAQTVLCGGVPAHTRTLLMSILCRSCSCSLCAGYLSPFGYAHAKG